MAIGVHEERVRFLGIPNLQDMNLSLIGSWVKRYTLGEGALWGKIVDSKYNTKSPNILSCHDTQPSTFWKGVMWASRAIAIGYRWKMGNVKLIKFWEDTWFGNSPLATQFWDVYFISNQQSKTIADMWDGSQLKCDFRRTFTEELMLQWHEILAIAQSISLSDESD